MISITAATATVGMLPLPSFASTEAPVHWTGKAMGIDASLILHGKDASRSQEAITAATDEITRLEKVFSLFQEDSALSILNWKGALSMPPLDLVMCLYEAQNVSRETNGAFDVSVQPLWALYAKHFSKSDANPTGPNNGHIASARSLVNYKNISVSTDEIVLKKSGMALTLNGIAQGYITDKVSDLLRSYGFENVLVNMGETRALGTKPDGSPWNVGINKIDHVLPLDNQAIATSGGYGTQFDVSGLYHHLFDPKTGRSSSLWSSISVIAPSATTADALSTAFSAMGGQEIKSVAEVLNVSVLGINANGETIIKLN